ncbi:MAG TPA: tripartite tricarboxylate transporter substrate binding protein [Burkholderiales bacterium]|nr:tripartite tricarboxylate transporter substrate binding protein [Burkholderiales bacterium]
MKTGMSMLRGSKPALALALACAHAVSGAAADPARDYPSRPIRLIMPNAPGSSADTMGRIAAQRLGESLGQQIVVDNRAGAGGALGLEIGRNATPDGYTLITTSLGALTVSPHIRKNLGYDPIRDFEYVALYSRQGNVLVVNPAVPAKSVKELIEHARAKQGQINMATAGPGSQSHLNGTALMMAAGFSSLHVPYKGGGPSMAAVIAGEAHWSIAPAGAMMSHVRAGRLRALGHSLPQRSPLYGDLPAIAETVPGFKYVAFSGFLAPKGVPRPILDRIRAHMAKALASPEMREALAAQGAEPASGTPEEFRRAIQEELVEMGRLVKAIGLKVE